MSGTKVINDFSITIATVNGSGSQTANVTILRALFKMGIPVSGKNLFPSNIQGQPTWYTIRVNKDGYLARRDEHEIVVALNPASFARDLANVLPGGAFFHADDINLPITRDDIVVYPMPVKEIIRKREIAPNLRDMVANMVYVGILAQLLGIDMKKVHQALDFHFKGNEKAVDTNYKTAEISAAWAATHMEKRDIYYVRSMDKTKDLIMTDGNTAAALGAIYGGVQFAAWYPITPATSLAEALNNYLPTLRKAENGTQTYAIIQAEDELAAIGMAIGAGWAGLRAMTSTSGPGLSLMTEYAGLAYYAEVPIVIWDIQRIGPSTGLPTRTSQGDLTFVNFMGHGDTQYVILLPGTINECFEFGWLAFDLAERLQTPIFILSDLDMGMNQWMAQPLQYPDRPMDRGKVLWEKDLEARNGIWARYKDIDGDGIPYRTIPGNPHPSSAWLGRGTGHDENARYTEDAVTWEANMARLRRKFESTRRYVPKPIIETMDDADVGIIAYGSTHPAVQEARYLLNKENNIKTDYLRLRALPCTQEVFDFVKTHQRLYVAEANRDSQLRQMLTLAMPEHGARFLSACHSDGLPLTARWVRDAILVQENK